MDELVLEPCLVEKRHCAPGRNSAQAAHSASEKPPPWLLLHSDVTFLEKRHQLAYPGRGPALDRGKNSLNCFNNLRLLEVPKLRHVPTCRHVVRFS